MTSGDWAEIDRLYLEAFSLPPTDRAAFLDQACNGDHSLRAEVESLLNADLARGQFLNAPPSRLTADLLQHRAGAVTSIGPYRILRVLGEGGMGTVYQAEQQTPHRIVALKVIKAGMASEQVMRRFAQEAEALGRLQHPGIAQIYDAGTADRGFGPQPYFAMEFIEGRALMEHAAERPLDARAKLELMAKICDAVNHAHQRGILHRDLKPGNILVDETGQPKILDFGVARVMDSDAPMTRQTDLGQLIGTLAYMSPEQALANPLDLDIRSDVYALGVILYELLAGKLPYETKGSALHAAVQAIRERDPAPLTAVDRGYRGDIETIVAKALEKDKSRRYASAGELARDIRRYLTDRPIVARPPTTVYQLRKFSRRHQAMVIGSAAVLVALIAGVIVSTMQMVRARTAERAADSEAAAATAVNEFLENDLLAQASATSQSGPNTRADPDLKVRTALDRAAARIDGKFSKQPEVEASIRDTIGETYIGLGLYSEARKQLERALELRSRILGIEAPKTLKTMSRIAQVDQDQGLFAQQEALYSQVLETQRRVLGPEHPDTLSTMNGLASAYDVQAKYAQADALYSRNLEIQRRVLGPEHPATVTTLGNLALVYHAWGNYEQAERLQRQSLEIRRRMLGPEHPATLTNMRDLAITYNSLGKYAEGEKLLSQAVEIQRRVLGPEHPNTLFSLNNLAVSYDGLGKHAQAEALFSQVLELKRRVLGAAHPSTLNTMNWLAGSYILQGKYPQAETLYSQTLELRRRVLSSEHQDTMASAAGLAMAYQEQGKFAATQPLAREVMEVDRQKRPDDWQGFLGESLLGASLAGQKKYAEAEPLLLAGFKGMDARQYRIAVPDRGSLERARQWIAKLYQAWGRPREAVAWMKK